MVSDWLLFFFVCILGQLFDISADILQDFVLTKCTRLIKMFFEYYIFSLNMENWSFLFAGIRVTQAGVDWTSKVKQCQTKYKSHSMSLCSGR